LKNSSKVLIRHQLSDKTVRQKLSDMSLLPIEIFAES
jgi:hypothetical protein